MSAFSIDSFRASLINGLARNNLFLIQGNFPGATTSVLQGVAAGAGLFFGGLAGQVGNTVANFLQGDAANAGRVSFLCKASKLPVSTLNINKAMYMGREYKYPGDRAFADWSITLYNDGDYSLRKAFEGWFNLINSNRTNVGPNAMNQFMVDWLVTPLTREGNPIVSYKLVGCWPSTFGDVNLDMAAQTEPSTFDVTIAYQYFEMQGTGGFATT